MKRLFLFLTAALLLTTARAQVLSVFVNDAEVHDGDTVHLEAVFSYENYGSEESPIWISRCVWDPELKVVPTKNISGSVEVSATDKGWQLCWPSSCKSVSPTKPASSDGTFMKSGTDLMIHCEVSAYDEELVIPEDNTATVVITAGDETFTVTLINDGIAGVKNVVAASGEARYYNLQGLEVNNPEAGIFIKVCGGKTTKVIMK